MPTFLENLAERHAVADRIELAKLDRDRRTLAALQAQADTTALLEDCWASSDPYQSGNAQHVGLGSSANDLLIYGAIGRHAARPGSRRDGCMPPYYYTEMQHWHIVDAARTVEAFCPTAVCVLDVLSQFVIFTGFSYTCVPKEAGGDQGLADKAQEFLDDWQRRVGWYAWENELFRRSRRDGEAFVVLVEDDTTGELSLRAVEPEQVKEPQDRTAVNSGLGLGDRGSWRFGILTTREDTSDPLGYWVVSQYNDEKMRGEFYESDEIFHLKTEWVDRQSKRGVSDFFSVANDITGVKKLLRNLREGATVQAAIAWIREHPNEMLPDALGPNAAPITTRGGNSATAVTYEGPTILDVSAGMTYTAGPLGAGDQNSAMILVLQAALRNIGARWQMPEGVVSGDASNANLASALVAEGPFTRALQARQWWYRDQYRQLMERVLDHAAANGLLGGSREDLLDVLTVSVETPAVIARKQKEDTERNAILSERGILSNQDWSSREDLDFDDQQRKIEESPIEPMVIGMGMGEPEDDTQAANPSQDNEGERV